MSVAADIVSGFLGSGKTTLLRHVLANGLQASRVAVVMNEIGDVAIDGQVLTGLSGIEKMVELSNGCICCSIDEYRFDVAIQELVDTARPDLIVMESTGVADPGPLADRARRAGLRVDAVITVVDGANIERYVAETAVAGRQVAEADFLVLNKTDLTAAAHLPRLERRLRRLNRRAPIFRTIHGAVEVPLLFAPGVAAYRRAAASGAGRAAAAGAHLREDRIEAFVYRTSRRLRQEAFERVVARLPRDVYRAKGIIRFAERDWPCLFNYTCGRSEVDWARLPELGRETQLVMIGRELSRYRDRVRRQIARCEVGAEAET